MEVSLFWWVCERVRYRNRKEDILLRDKTGKNIKRPHPHKNIEEQKGLWVCWLKTTQRQQEGGMQDSTHTQGQGWEVQVGSSHARQVGMSRWRGRENAMP